MDTFPLRFVITVFQMVIVSSAVVVTAVEFVVIIVFAVPVGVDPQITSE